MKICFRELQRNWFIIAVILIFSFIFSFWDKIFLSHSIVSSNSSVVSWEKFSGKEYSINYPTEFQLDKHTLSYGYDDVKGTIFGVSYQTSEGEFEFSVESDIGGYDGPLQVPEQITINGRKFNKVLILDNDNIVRFIYVFPENPIKAFHHIQGTFPKNDNKKYIEIFNTMISSLKIHDI